MRTGYSTQVIKRFMTADEFDAFNKEYEAHTLGRGRRERNPEPSELDYEVVRLYGEGKTAREITEQLDLKSQDSVAASINRVARYKLFAK